MRDVAVGRLTEQVAAEEQPRADAARFEMGDE